MHKGWNRRKKGVAGIIAATMLFAMIFTTGTAYFIFVNQNYQLQHIAASDKNQMEFDQSLEQFIVTGVLITGNKIGVRVNNTGSITIKIVSIFVSDNAGAIYPPLDPLSVFVNSGAISSLIDTGVNYNVSRQYAIKVVSGRGNIESGQYPLPPTPEAQIALIARGVGPVLTVFESFQWASYSVNLNGLNLPTLSWNPGWSVPVTSKVIWRITVINHDTKDIYLDNRTVFIMLQILGSDTAHLKSWYIVNATGGRVSAYMGSGYATDGSIIIPANLTDPALGGPETTLYFASKNPHATDSQGISTSDKGTWIVLATVIGKWSDRKMYAQTLLPISATEVI